MINDEIGTRYIWHDVTLTRWMMLMFLYRLCLRHYEGSIQQMIYLRFFLQMFEIMGKI